MVLLLFSNQGSYIIYSFKIDVDSVADSYIWQIWYEYDANVKPYAILINFEYMYMMCVHLQNN